MRFHLVFLIAVISIAGLFGFTEFASAQWRVSANLVVAIPTNEFSDVTDTGTGIDLKGEYGIRSLPFFSLRADAIFLTYQYAIYNSGFYTVETRTQSIRFLVGPQFSARIKRAVFYAAPMYGINNFHTREDVFGTILSRTRNSSTEFGWSVNGGVQIGIYRMPDRNFDLAIDIGGSWHNVPDGIKQEIEVDERTVTEKWDVTEICIHAGITMQFR